MGVIQFPTRAATHGPRDTAGDILPAGGTARPVPPPSGRADELYDGECAKLRLVNRYHPLGRADQFGILGAAHEAAERQMMLDVIVSGLSILALIGATAFALFMIGACIVAPEWLAGWL